jgi:hypothetical protein
MVEIWENNDVDDNLENMVFSTVSNAVQDATDFIRMIPRYVTTPSQRRQRIPGFDSPNHKVIKHLDVLDKED